MTTPYYDIDCTCGEGVLIAAEGVADGTGVECPGCGHTIYASADSEDLSWLVSYDDALGSDYLCFGYCDGDVPEGCELMEAT